jgi:hypothetical protein
MAWTAPSTVIVGQLLTDTLWNQQVRDNMLETAAAKVTTAGDTVYATAANALARRAIGSARQFMRVNSSGNAPECFTPPAVRARHASDQAVANTTATALSLTAERYDTNGMHDTSTNHQRLTSQASGLYHIGGCAAFASNATGNRTLEIRRGGTTVLAAETRAAVSGAITTIVVSCDYELSSSEYVELVATQNSGGSLDVLALSNYSPEFWMHWIGPA